MEFGQRGFQSLAIAQDQPVAAQVVEQGLLQGIDRGEQEFERGERLSCARQREFLLQECL